MHPFFAFYIWSNLFPTMMLGSVTKDRGASGIE